MNTIDRDIQVIIYNDLAPKLEHVRLSVLTLAQRVAAFVKPVQQIVPLSIISGLCFIIGITVYVTHSQTLSPDLGILFFTLSFIGCTLAAYSLVSEKGIAHALQAAGGLIGNTNLMVLFLSFLNHA